MTAAKTEHTIYRRCLTPVSEDLHVPAEDDAWRVMRKLDSLLGDTDDISHRKIPAVAAFGGSGMWSPRLPDKTRNRLYSGYVLSTLIYNYGTWALAPTGHH
ncbi:LOW QUALITY PROTEIN: hypothetical protein PHMEG_0005694 [Phytophthora megakarya]|uniref:Uncharacterized protein n=1 Tax=Phytophthora megakarya TaxID=4795 RepID=A0A225WQT3_9STRA|nr:LOW QUALITY PROTEIN: hypothetical protein PHMEG_0005694 [Phytophthora megakarya]